MTGWTFDPATLNRLQVLAALGGFCLGLITLYVPTWVFLRGLPAYDTAAFSQQHPERKHAPAVFNILSFVVILTAPLTSIFLLAGVQAWWAPVVFFTFFSNSLGIFNGIFEAVTGVCPTRGIAYRHSIHHQFICHPRVRKTGLLRAALGMAFMAASLILFHA
ncbi:MAG TPA: hypothetical protein PKW33_12750 [Anaerolineaceae bacterium]|nr:hypothetical protein [Anaerolineaceae bacterium]HPN52452.1 hypothetical protein [Anaerolineaceae bacterium]